MDPFFENENKNVENQVCRHTRPHHGVFVCVPQNAAQVIDGDLEENEKISQNSQKDAENA